MKTYEVRFRPSAERDLFELYTRIAERAGEHVAVAYVDRITESCRSLAVFPRRGLNRNDLRPGVRQVGFERRATILFRVLPDRVQILRILNGGRDIDAALVGSDGDLRDALDPKDR
jgi:toxin ParE1/3/4